MDWIPLTSSAQLADIIEKSKHKPQLIFKHSTRCSISSMAKNRLERVTPPENIDFYYLDLISYRELSSKIAEEFDVFHESPQVILIKNGECSYDESHSGINMDDIIEQAALQN
jgi:bacillithiol system protein YtxJ